MPPVHPRPARPHCHLDLRHQSRLHTHKHATPSGPEKEGSALKRFTLLHAPAARAPLARQQCRACRHAKQAEGAPSPSSSSSIALTCMGRTAGKQLELTAQQQRAACPSSVSMSTLQRLRPCYPISLATVSPHLAIALEIHKCLWAKPASSLLCHCLVLGNIQPGIGLGKARNPTRVVEARRCPGKT